LRSIQKDVLAYETKIENLYESVLGEDPGKDPLGTLLYRLEQRRGGGQSGIDVMGLLAVLSEEAPPGFTVESLSYNGDSGGIRALTDSFDKLDAMLERLRANDEYEFTLEQATNTEDGVLMSLNFTLK
jgi:type II secretory pathway component PulL